MFPARRELTKSFLVPLLSFVLISSLALPSACAEEKPAAAAASAADAGAPIAAAASLRYALDEIAAQFEKKTGQRVRITYGATGNLVQQIEKAAPFQVLFAADDKSVKKLASEESLTEGTPVIFARGRISIVAPKGSPVAVDGELKGLGDALAAGKVAHFAIANPDVAPYGVAAREALQKAGLWDKLTGKIVLGENVGQAAQFATTGAAEAGIIGHSLALSAEMAHKITAALYSEVLAQADRARHGRNQGGRSARESVRRLRQGQRGARDPGEERLLRTGGLRQSRHGLDRLLALAQARVLDVRDDPARRGHARKVVGMGAVRRQEPDGGGRHAAAGAAADGARLLPTLGLLAGFGLRRVPEIGFSACRWYSASPAFWLPPSSSTCRSRCSRSSARSRPFAATCARPPS